MPRYLITHWHPTAAHDRRRVEFEAADWAAAHEHALKLGGFGHSLSIALLPDPAPAAPEPEPEPHPVPEPESAVVVDVSKPKRSRRTTREGA